MVVQLYLHRVKIEHIIFLRDIYCDNGSFETKNIAPNYTGYRITHLFSEGAETNSLHHFKLAHYTWLLRQQIM